MGFLNSAGLERLWNHICSELSSMQEQIGNHAHNKLVVDNTNYGTELPSTGVEGQIFFKQVT